MLFPFSSAKKATKTKKKKWNSAKIAVDLDFIEKNLGEYILKLGVRIPPRLMVSIVSICKNLENPALFHNGMFC